MLSKPFKGRSNNNTIRLCRTQRQTSGLEDFGGPILVFFRSFPQNRPTTPLDTQETKGIILKCSKRNDPGFE